MVVFFSRDRRLGSCHSNSNWFNRRFPYWDQTNSKDSNEMGSNCIAPNIYCTNCASYFESILIEHAGEGHYQLEKAFEKLGTYYVYYHIDTMGLHLMKKFEFTIK